MSREGRSVPRWPVLLILIAVLAAGIVVQQRRDGETQPAPPTPVAQFLPTAAGSTALSSTWYCAAGSATGTATGVAEQTVVIENASTRDLLGQVTAMTDTGKSATRLVKVPARDHLDVRVSDLIVAPYAAAMVEMNGGEVAVAHVLTGPSGTSTAACSSAPSSHWYFPAGNTTPGTRYLLALFNPFPSDAIATVTFQTEAGLKNPAAADGVVVPGGQVTVLAVDGLAPIHPQVSAFVDVREGRLIVDQVMATDGSQIVKGLSVTPGAPRGAPSWWFADGGGSASLKTTFVVINPGSQTARVSLAVRLDDEATNGKVSPYTTTVAPGGASTIDINANRRLPVGLGFTAVASSAGDRPIVVEQMSVTDPTASPAGFQVAMGSPVVARQWLAPVGTTTTTNTSVLVVTNPSATHAIQMRLATVTGGTVAPLGGTEASVTIAAGGRGRYIVPTAAVSTPTSFLVIADGPVVVQQLLAFTKAGLAGPLAVPLVVGATTEAPGRF